MCPHGGRRAATVNTKRSAVSAMGGHRAAFPQLHEEAQKVTRRQGARTPE